jgi:hypothetical protein
MVASEVLKGYQRSRSPLDSFDNFFGDSLFSRNRGVYETKVVPSNPLTLEVRALPSEGKPPGFAGHVGDYRITASASPKSVKVGDPITLTIALSGPEYLEHVALPSLQDQPALARDFKIPSEMAEGQYNGRSKVFTQTIRAQQPEVSQIPPIELPYFDTARGVYSVAQTDPIPIEVSAARVVTAADAEGLDPSAPAAAVQAWTEGIAHNYSGADVILDQRYGPRTWIRSPAWLGVIAFPPAAYSVLLIAVLAIRRRNADPAKIRARKAFRGLEQRLAAARQKGAEEAFPELLSALREYLGLKLNVPSAAMTFKDARGPLSARGADDNLLGQLEQVFRQCEAGRYAGPSNSEDTAVLGDRCLDLARKLETLLK